MKWFMNIINFMYARPYLAEGAVIPERNGLRYAYHVCVGTKYWAYHEMSLWKAWALSVSSLILCVALTFALGENSPDALVWIVLISPAIVFGITFIVALFTTVSRGIDWVFGTPWALWLLGSSVVGAILYDFYHHPDAALRMWNETSWFFYVMGTVVLILIIAVIIVTILTFFKKRKARS